MQRFFSSVSIFLLALLILAGGAGCTKKMRSDRHLGRGDRYFAAGDYDRAETEYISALKLDHESGRALAQLGTIYFTDGRLGRAYYVFLQALRFDTNNLDLHLHLGQFYMAAGKPKEAMNEALFVLGRRPLDESAPLLLADSTVTQKDFDAARAYLQKLPVPPEKLAPIQVALGGLFYREHRIKEAQAEWFKAKQTDPKFAPLYTALGNYYTGENQLQLADEAFKTSIESAPPRSPLRLKYAQFKLQIGDLEGAKKLLEEMFKQTPDVVPVDLALGQIALAQKHYDDALLHARSVLARDDENYDALLLEGRTLLLQNQAAAAVTILDKMSRSYSKSPTVFYQLGLAYSAAGDSLRAASSLNQALKFNPKFSEATVALAQLKIAKGEYASASSLLQTLAQQHPEIGQAQLLLADAYRLQGDADSALKTYQQLELTYPKNSETHLMHGVLLSQLNRKSEARRQFESALANGPDNLLALEQLTDLDLNEKHYASALARLKTVTDRNPSQPETFLLVAKVYVAETNFPEATLAISKQIEAHPDFIAGYLMLAHLYTLNNQNPKALEILKPLLEKHPDNISALMQAAGVHEQMKDFKAAREAYEKLLTHDPNYSPALNNLAYLDINENELDKAYTLAKHAREILPNDPATADTLGWVLYRKGNYAEALPLLRDAGAKIITGEVQLHVGLAYYMSGNEEGARAWLLSAMKSSDDFPFKAEAIPCLAVLAIDPQTAGPDAQSALEKRISNVPNDSIALARLAALYQRNGKPDKALANYEAALKYNPQNGAALWELAKIYSTRPQQNARAFELAKSAYKFSPTDPAIPRLLGRLAFLNGDDRWSVTLLESASRKQPNDRELAYDLAESEYSIGEIKDAENAVRAVLKDRGNFSRATVAQRMLDMDALWTTPTQAVASALQVEAILKEKPDFLPAQMVAGVIHQQKGDASAAREDFEKILARHPAFTPAMRQLVILYSQTTTEDKKAYDLAVKAREAYPDDAEVAKALGIILYRNGDFSRAAKMLAESQTQKATDAQLAYYLGMAQYKLRQRSDSKKSLSRAIELKLPDPLAADARKVLAELK